MSKIQINKETNQLTIDFSQENTEDKIVFQNIAEMLDNIREGAEALVICIALENYIQSEQCYRLFTKPAVEEIPFQVKGLQW